MDEAADGRPPRRSVLVVDDDDAIRHVVRAVLEAGDFEVLEASDGESALELLSTSNGEAPAVVVLDVMMPGLDGIEVCRRIDHDRAKVLMLTARLDAGTEQASKDAGAVAFLTKPFSAIDLLEAVEALLA
jgi:CheY-like chemotaxis protein